MDLLGLVDDPIRMTMIKRFVFLSICALASSAQQTSTNSAGAISGILRGDDGTAIAGAHVSLHVTTSRERREIPIGAFSVISGSDGSFRFGLFHPGSYRLVAQAPGPWWVDACEWGLEQQNAALTAAQNSANVTAIMKKGVAVPIRVEDPDQLLSKNEGKTTGAHLLLGVASDAFVFHEAALISSDSTGRNYQIVIPFGSPTKLVVNGGFFLLSGAAGEPLARGKSGSIPITVPAGQQPPVVRMAVTGTAR